MDPSTKRHAGTGAPPSPSSTRGPLFRQTDGVYHFRPPPLLSHHVEDRLLPSNRRSATLSIEMNLDRARHSTYETERS
jgi:hypothetical protein